MWNKILYQEYEEAEMVQLTANKGSWFHSVVGFFSYES